MTGASTLTAPTGARIVTPRLPHKPNWSSQPSTFGAGSARVSGTSPRVARNGWVVDCRRHRPTPYAGMIRFRFGGRRPVVALSARYARTPACQ